MLQIIKKVEKQKYVVIEYFLQVLNTNNNYKVVEVGFFLYSEITHFIFFFKSRNKITREGLSKWSELFGKFICGHALSRI